MSQYSSLKATIDANIKTNDNEEITGYILNSVLNEMVDNLAAGYLFKGVATPATNPGSPDEKVFYVATPGTYTYFGNQTVPEATTGFFRWDTSWHLDTISTGVADGAITTAKIANGAVTAAKLSASLVSILLETGYKYMGVASPTGNPGTPGQRVFYLAGAGNYPNYGNATVNEGYIGILAYDTAWSVAAVVATEFSRTTNNGFLILDDDLNIGLKYDLNGLDVGKVSYHFLQLLEQAGIPVNNPVITSLSFIEEVGFAVVDYDLNIGMILDSQGLHAANILEYQIIT